MEPMDEMGAEEALRMVEERIRHQMSAAPIGSIEWAAHMADLMHVESVRKDLSQ